VTTVDTALLVRLEASLAKFERQMARARQVGSGTARGIQRDFDRTNRTLGDGSARAAQGLGRVVSISGAGRFVLQNTANQIGDIAVQLQGGAGASRALGQQLPQLLGGFGALGGTLGLVAPLLGTVAALGIPIAAAFLAMGQNASDAGTLMEEAADAVDEVGKRTQALETGVQTLRTLEDELAAAIVSRGVDQTSVSESSIRAIQAEIEARRAAINLEQIQAQRAIENARARVAELERARDAVIEEARSIQAGLTEISPGASFAEVEAVTRRIVQETQAYLDTQAEVIASYSAAAAELAAQEALHQAIREALADSEGAADGLTAALGNADMSHLVAQAQQLAQELGVSLDIASRIAVMQNASSMGGASGPDDAIAQAQMGPTNVVASYRTPTPSGSSGRSGGGGGASETTEAMRTAASIIREVESASIGLADVQSALNEMFASGAIDVETYNAALEAARDRFADATDAAKFWETQQKALKDGILDAIVKGEDLADTFRNIAQAIARAALEAALFGSGPFAQGGSGGGGGGLLGGLFGGLFGGFRASGGPVSGGTPYVVGERGPELFVPSASGKIVPGLPGGGGNVNVTVINNSGQPIERRESRGPDGQRLVEITVGRAIAEGRFDRAMAARFGTTPQRVRQ
jgi:hypothetical protein